MPHILGGTPQMLGDHGRALPAGTGQEDLTAPHAQFWRTQAFLTHVCQRLLMVVANPASSSVDKGIMFFALIRRRLQTMGQDRRSVPQQLGLENRDLHVLTLYISLDNIPAMDTRFVLLGIAFVWDSNKASTNLRQHGIPFE
jgi:hypothetical protein